jgi:hypothetical protein
MNLREVGWSGLLLILSLTKFIDSFTNTFSADSKYKQK